VTCQLYDVREEVSIVRSVSPYLFEPNPDLSPDDVVKIQLDALQNNDLTPDNEGIRLAFRFASPQNQEVTGPIERFIHIIKRGDYAPMVGFERAEVGVMLVLGDYAQQRVRVINRRRGSATYIFTLSRQHEPPYADCWMIDAVLREHE
jgi:hypothetical protein